MIIGIVIMIGLWLSIIVFAILSQWKVFEKAGQTGWECLIIF